MSTCEKQSRFVRSSPWDGYKYTDSDHRGKRDVISVFICTDYYFLMLLFFKVAIVQCYSFSKYLFLNVAIVYVIIWWLFNHHVEEDKSVNNASSQVMTFPTATLSFGSPSNDHSETTPQLPCHWYSSCNSDHMATMPSLLPQSLLLHHGARWDHTQSVPLPFSSGRERAMRMCQRWPSADGEEEEGREEGERSVTPLKMDVSHHAAQSATQWFISQTLG